MRTDYALLAVRMKGWKGYLAKGYLQDEDKGYEALARTQVHFE